jgi:hypothetical protein
MERERGEKQRGVRGKHEKMERSTDSLDRRDLSLEHFNKSEERRTMQKHGERERMSG